MTTISTMIGLIASIFGMGTGMVSQGMAVRQQLRPSAQAQPYTQCPPGTTGQAQQMADGSYRIVCVQQQGNP